MRFATDHSLRLVAPWYRWQRQRDLPATRLGPLPRQTRPVFQKYTSSAQAVKLFLDDPQRTYAFTKDERGPEDRVTVGTPSPFKGRMRALADRLVLQTPLRKLYRETHQRAYLVVCEMHCDAPGFPDAAWSHIREMGFVVRRWVPRDPAWMSQRIDALNERLAWLRAIDLRLTGRTLLVRDPLVDGPGWARALMILLLAQPQLRTTLILPLIERTRARRVAIEVPEPVRWKRQYWELDKEHEGIGRWRDLSAGFENPSALKDLQERREKVYPLYKLVPDPRLEKHLSLGAKLVFGSVPTSDMETDLEGEPHLVHTDTYEIRCFVHQLRDCCSGQPARGRCPAGLRWSEGSEPYRIAEHFDPVGTSNTVVNIEMPDLGQLMAQPVTGSQIRLNWPKLSKPDVSLSFPPGGSLIPEAKICTTSIPLVTIVATFLLELFTPIVVYIFSLYHLLLARFCLPPGLGLPVLPAPPAPLISITAARDAEYELLADKAIFDGLFDTRAVPGRTDRLEWDIVFTERPAVDAAPLIGAGV